MKLPLICPKRECCCRKKDCIQEKGLPRIVLVGSPNVGKSSLFNALSGSYTVVSNYPGTSVEISRGKGRIGDRDYEIIDTPGIYSLLPVSEETYSRMQWYFLEVLPLFVLASFLIWIGKLTGLFDFARKMIAYPTVWIGLPPNAADIFLFGFFRRDFGAAGLYGMHDAGLLTGVQLVVAAVTLTLFIPCVAQFTMTIKERGLKTALIISAFIFPFAFFTGFVVHTLLTVLGVSL